MEISTTAIKKICADFSALRVQGKVNDENDVRHYLIDTLVYNAWGFRKSPLETIGTCVEEKVYPSGHTTVRADYLLCATSKVVIEAKADHVELDNDVYNQTLSYANLSNSDEFLLINGRQILVYVMTTTREKGVLIHTANVDDLSDESANFLANLFNPAFTINTANLRALAKDAQERQVIDKRVGYYKEIIYKYFVTPDLDIVKRWAIICDNKDGVSRRYTTEALKEEAEYVRMAFENMRTDIATVKKIADGEDTNTPNEVDLLSILSRNAKKV